MNKKIIIFAVLLIFIFALGSLFFLKKSKTDLPQETAGLPPPINTYPNDNSAPVAGPDSQESIKSAFDRFKKKVPEKDIEWTQILDNEGRSISLDKFSRATGLILNPKMNNLLDQADFDLFSCPTAYGKDTGIVFNIKLLPDYSGNLYQDELKIMRDWEKTMFNDTQKILFSNVNFTPEQLQQQLIFKDGQYRYAEIIMPGNAKTSINYAIIDDYVILASSQKCVNEAADTLLPME